MTGAESNKRLRQIRELVLTCLGSNYSLSNLFVLLLNTSQFEFRLRSMYKRLLSRRHENFDKYRHECRTRMSKLLNIYAASNEGGSGRKNMKLKDWITAIDDQMSHLNFEGQFLYSKAPVSVHWDLPNSKLLFTPSIGCELK